MNLMYKPRTFRPHPFHPGGFVLAFLNTHQLNMPNYRRTISGRLWNEFRDADFARPGQWVWYSQLFVYYSILTVFAANAPDSEDYR